MKLPTLKRNTNSSGKKVGSFWIMFQGERINLLTQDATEALRRRRRAMKGERTFPTDSEAAADATIAGLEETPDEAPAVDDAPISAGEIGSRVRLLAAVPDEAAPSSPTPTGAGDWAADANAAAGTADAHSPTAAAADPSRPKFSELPFLQSAFISASKFAVQIQVGIQAWAARRWLGLELPSLEAPPKSLEDFLEKQGKPWADGDPREPGRQVWESFLRRMVPEDLPIPDYLLAPALVAIFTLAVQMPQAKAVKPDAEQQGDAQAPDASAAAA